MITRPNVKLNLGLNVISKRPDGFHDLETLFIPCDAYRDILSIEESDAFSIRIEGEMVCWDPQSDLCARAYRLLEKEFGIPPVDIRLVKNNPVGAGLGGGSSDCAFTLRMLRDMFSLPICDEQLAQRASTLGSDCAFFIYDRPMFASGRGEVLTPFPMDFSSYEFRVEIPPGLSVSTALAYREIMDAVKDLERPTLREVLAMDVSLWKENLQNDFERVIFPLYPQIASLKEEMYERGAVYAAMSGSGSAVFGMFKKQLQI